jgi:Domain of unknown function (DUF5655)
MSQSEREQEREFLADLEARTGRDLAAWMALISAQAFGDKNETIDWLRAQGLPFARASWLERIHSNGGRPIYGDETPKAADPGKPPPPAPPPPKPQPAPRAPTARETADLEKLLAAGKGYRPLYQMLEGEIRRTLPGVTIAAKAGYISLGHPREFAAVTLHATELRLGLDLGERGFDAVVQKAKMRGPGPTISHMLVLTDARQVNADLINLIKAADAKING